MERQKERKKLKEGWKEREKKRNMEGWERRIERTGWKKGWEEGN